MNDRSKKRSLNFYKWTSIFFLSLTLISGSVLIYQWWDKKQLRKVELERIKQEVEQYELQQNNLISTVNLSQSQQVKKFFTDLLRTYSQKFADNQKLNISHYPLVFSGFYVDEKISQGKGEMGHCAYRSDKTVEISLNQLYLLNKFGHERYFATHPNQNSYFYLDINFARMIKTCSHELAHYLQFVKHGKSSCSSDLKLGNGKYNLTLAKEHKEFKKEIFEMINNSREYKELEKKWREINNS